jgi:hypothetical protein
MFKKLASNFHINVDFNILDGLPEYTHTYGNKQLPPVTPHWMTYAEPADSSWGLEPGTISFTRLTRHLLPDVTGSVVQKLIDIFGNVIPWHEDRVHIIRTTGFILPHVDEVRTAVINIGLKNSSTSETRLSRHGNMDDFRTGEVDTHICEDGGVYALDVTKYHAVYPIIDTARYLITYGFGIPYAELINKLG